MKVLVAALYYSILQFACLHVALFSALQAKPAEVNNFEGQKVVTIAAGDEFSLVIDDRCYPWGWGRAEQGQVHKTPICTLHIGITYIHITDWYYLYTHYILVLPGDYSVERHLNLNGRHTSLIWTYSQVGRKCCFHNQLATLHAQRSRCTACVRR